MKWKQTVYRVVRDAAAPLWYGMNRDPITFAKIKPRDDLQELGTAYGGWIVPTRLLGAGSLCYCVGCGEDISFDLELIERFGCEVHGFDPTPRAIEHVRKETRNVAAYHFSEVGLWHREETLRFYAPLKAQNVSHSVVNLQQTERYFLADVKRLSTIMEEKGHTGLDLLKLDIEGAEYEVLKTLIEDDVHVGVLCVEFDEYSHPLDANYAKRIRASVGRLTEAGFVLVYARGGDYTFVSEAGV